MLTCQLQPPLSSYGGNQFNITEKTIKLTDKLNLSDIDLSVLKKAEWFQVSVSHCIIYKNAEIKRSNSNLIYTSSNG